MSQDIVATVAFKDPEAVLATGKVDLGAQIQAALRRLLPKGGGITVHVVTAAAETKKP